jgi:transposase
MAEQVGKTKRRGAPHNHEFKQAAVRLVESGQTMAAIGRTLQIPEQTLSYCVHALSIQSSSQTKTARMQARHREIAQVRSKQVTLAHYRAKQKVIADARAKQKTILCLQAEWVSAKQSKLNRLHVERLSAKQAKFAHLQAVRIQAGLARRERLQKEAGRVQMPANGIKSNSAFKGVDQPFVSRPGGIPAPYQNAEQLVSLPHATDVEMRFKDTQVVTHSSLLHKLRPDAQESKEPSSTEMTHDLLTDCWSSGLSKQDVTTVCELAARIHELIAAEPGFAASTPLHLLCAFIRLITCWSDDPRPQNQE